MLIENIFVTHRFRRPVRSIIFCFILDLRHSELIMSLNELASLSHRRLNTILKVLILRARRLFICFNCWLLDRIVSRIIGIQKVCIFSEWIPDCLLHVICIDVSLLLLYLLQFKLFCLVFFYSYRLSWLELLELLAIRRSVQIVERIDVITCNCWNSTCHRLGKTIIEQCIEVALVCTI